MAAHGQSFQIPHVFEHAKLWQRMLVLMTIAFCWLCGAPSSGQQTPPVTSSSTPTIRTVTRSIILDVVATDKSGLPVSGLTREDFNVLEDGKPQVAASFDDSATAASPTRFRLPAATEGSTGAIYPASQETIIVLDEMNTSFADTSYARFRLDKFLHQNAGRLTQPTSLLALTNDGLIELHSATLDGAAIWKTLDHHRAALPWRQLNDTGSERERLNRSAFALHQIAVAETGSSVRRNLVWVTPGFPLVSTSPFGGASQQGLYDSIRQLSDEMLRARIVVYTVDPRGAPVNLLALDFTDPVPGQSPTQVSAIRSTGFVDIALERFARETGGRSFWGRNDLDAEIEHAISEGSVYYTLSYHSSNRNFDGRFRKIVVTVNRPGVKLSTRAGYFAVADPALISGDQLWLPIEEALRNPLTYTGIPLSATLLSGRDGTQHLSVTLPRDRLVWHDATQGTQECDLRAEVEIFTNKGKPLRTRRYSLRGKRQVDSNGRASQENNDQVVKIDLVLPSLGDAERLRLVVLDEASASLGTLDLLKPFAAASTLNVLTPSAWSETLP